MADQFIWPLILQFILISLNAIFACAEIAVISMKESKIQKLTEQGNKKAKKLAKLTEEPTKFLSTIQVAITLSGFLGSAFAANTFSDYITDAILSLGISDAYRGAIDSASVIIITLILSYFTLICGELVPKRIAMKKTEKIALALTPLVYFISKLFTPIVFLLTKSTNGVLRMFGIDPNEKDEEVSEEEIRMMVDTASENDVIDEEEKEIIQNVFEFDDLTVGEFCTHRTDLEILYDEDDVEEWDKTIHETRHSLYPICKETVDNVIGILNTKDYFRLSTKDKKTIMNEAVRPAYFIPEGIHADVLLRQMKETRNHFAVVLDEYGGTAGIVTMNDLLEQIVGDLESDTPASEETPEIENIGENTWKIMGTAPLDEVAEELGIEFEDDENETFGGLVFSSYGSVPEDGTTFDIEIGRLHINVTEIKEHRIESCIVVVSEIPDEESNDGVNSAEVYGTDE